MKREPVRKPAPDYWKGGRYLARVIGSDAWRARIEDQVVTLTNAERARKRLPQLRIDERLRQAARWHSMDMAARNFFSHINPEGFSPHDRMYLAGYDRPATENIARGQPKPPDVVHEWMNSPGHRANILHARVRTIGVGIHMGYDGPWWTQVFGY